MMKEALLEQLQPGPGEAARQEVAVGARCPLPSRWTLRTIRASLESLRDYTLSGVWYLLKRCGLGLHTSAIQLYSPDPEYVAKLRQLKHCLREAAQAPARILVLFLDEFGYYRWPLPAPTWGTHSAHAAREGNNQQWRTVGALNAWDGQVQYLDNYILGKRQLVRFYAQLDQAYPQAERIYLVQDNWNIHTHPEVLEALQAWPRLQPVWLPTYAPWLNPIEKLWRWVRQDVLKMHRWVTDWTAVRQQVRDFLDQFRHGSQDLLRYVGLLGKGKLAKAIHAS
jgi:transposase